jgi:hypothetical protein
MVDRMSAYYRMVIEPRSQRIEALPSLCVTRQCGASDDNYREITDLPVGPITSIDPLSLHRNSQQSIPFIAGAATHVVHCTLYLADM